MAIRRSIPFSLCLALLLWGCGGGEMSVAEYVERINGIAGQASERGAELYAEAAQVADPTPQQLQAGLERGLSEIRVPLQQAADTIDPPAQVSNLHHLMWDWHSEFISIERALAARAGTAEDSEAGWEALSDSPEMAAYRAAIVEGKQACADLQTELDAAEERGIFADTPWLRGQLSGVAEAVIGCEWFPENPEDVYRYPPPTSP